VPSILLNFVGQECRFNNRQKIKVQQLSQFRDITWSTSLSNSFVALSRLGSIVALFMLMMIKFITISPFFAALAKELLRP
jgi:hypothetical protein